MKKLTVGLIFLCMAILLVACSAQPTTQAVPSPVVLPSAFATFTPQPSPSATVSPTATATQAPTSSPSPTTTQTPTPTLTPIPTYTKLRGEVTIQQAVCHYGPGAPYLYKYGVYQGSHLEILRRVALGNYVEVQAIGGNNPCWVKADYFEFEGNWLDLEPVDAADVKLPFSPYYINPPSGVSAQRNGTAVTVSWNAYPLRAGDDSEQVPYLIESWVCQAGQMIFNPVGSWTNSATIDDEPGCIEDSHARLYAVEKHGYTHWITIPWPHPESTQTQ